PIRSSGRSYALCGARPEFPDRAWPPAPRNARAVRGPFAPRARFGRYAFHTPGGARPGEGGSSPGHADARAPPRGGRTVRRPRRRVWADRLARQEHSRRWASAHTTDSGHARRATTGRPPTAFPEAGPALSRGAGMNRAAGRPPSRATPGGRADDDRPHPLRHAESPRLVPLLSVRGGA